MRQGEKATPVYFWNWRTPEELDRLREQTGKDNLAPCTCFISAAKRSLRDGPNSAASAPCFSAIELSPGLLAPLSSSASGSGAYGQWASPGKYCDKHVTV